MNRTNGVGAIVGGGSAGVRRGSSGLDSAAKRLCQSANDSTKKTTKDKELVPLKERLRERPLIAVVDGRDCTVEMAALKDVATVAFCDASSIDEVHEKVLGEAVGLIMWNTIQLKAEDLEKFKKLKMIVRLENHAENVDITKATELGIAVCNVPGVGIEQTATFTIAMILNLYTGMHWTANALRNNDHTWNPEKTLGLYPSLKINGEVLGIVGLGMVGLAVGVRAQALGFKVLFYDPLVGAGIEQVTGFQRAYTLTDLLGNADCISLHCNLNGLNNKLINANTIQHMRGGAFLVNTAHENLIDEFELVAALEVGQIRAAALDVYKGAPGPVMAPLKDAKNLLVTPHCAYLAENTYKQFRELGAAEIRSGLTGELPFPLCFKNCINKEILQILQQNQSSQTVANPGTSTSFANNNLQTFGSSVALEFANGVFYTAGATPAGTTPAAMVEIVANQRGANVNGNGENRNNSGTAVSSGVSFSGTSSDDVEEVEGDVLESNSTSGSARHFFKNSMKLLADYAAAHRRGDI